MPGPGALSRIPLAGALLSSMCMVFQLWQMYFFKKECAVSCLSDASLILLCVCVCVCTCMCMLSHVWCLILCHPMDYSSPSSSVHEILLVRILEWVAISFSRGLPNLVIELMPLASPTLAGGFFTTMLPGKPLILTWLLLLFWTCWAALRICGILFFFFGIGKFITIMLSSSKFMILVFPSCLCIKPRERYWLLWQP